MRFLLIASALLLTAFAHQKDEMIQSNRVVTSIGTSCEECQSVVKRFSEAIKDPKKVQELKMLLNVLCHETSYVDECRLFVSRLEVFLEKLQPYLSDTHAVCAKMRLCSNNRIDAFRRLLLTLAKRVDSQMLTNFEGRVLCDECEFACKEVKAVVEDKATQTEIRDFIRGNICASLGTYRGFCDLIVDEYLPQFIQEVDAILQDPHQVCVDIHACDTSAVTQPRKWEPINIGLARTAGAVFWEQAGQLSTKTGQLAMSCFECQITADSFLDEAVNKRQEISNQIKEFSCFHLLPSNFTDSCTNVLDLYMPALVYMTIRQFTGEGICTSMSTCPHKSPEAYEKLSGDEKKEHYCESARAMEKYLVDNLVGSTGQQLYRAELSNALCSTRHIGWNTFCDRVVDASTARFAQITANLAGAKVWSTIKHC